VYDNASDVDLSEPFNIIQRRGWQFRKTEHYHGKREMWRWVNQVYQELNDVPQESMLAFFPQDIRLCQHFFAHAQAVWESINDPRKLTLTVLVDAQREKMPCWTGVPPQRRGRVYRTQWVDNAFVAELSYLQALRFRIPPVPASRWKRNPNLSSGVGRMISVQLHRAGFGLYRVENSLVDFIGDLVPKYLQTVRFIDTFVPFVKGATEKVHRKSKTHSRLPAVHMASSIRRTLYRSPVVVSLATMPGREKSLARTVASLLPQTDQLNVYLNGIDRVPDCLRAPHVHVARSSEHGDYGDAGKFWWCHQDDAYMLTCDDDIVYPPDYVARIVYAIEHYQRAAVVGVHGIILRPPILSYYRDRTVLHCARPLAQDQSVHMVGTGCAGWHSSTLNLTLHHFQTPNMADVWFGVACQQQRVPVVCIARPSNWLKIQKVTNTIFGRYRTRDQLQTRVVIANTPWKLLPLPSTFSLYPASLQNIAGPAEHTIRGGCFRGVGLLCSQGV
jgi:hypothetical protein